MRKVAYKSKNLNFRENQFVQKVRSLSSGGSLKRSVKATVIFFRLHLTIVLLKMNYIILKGRL